MLFSKMCPQCGRRNPADASYCNACGEQLVAPHKQRGCLGRSAMAVALLAVGILLLTYLTRPHGIELDELLSPGGQATPKALPTPGTQDTPDTSLTPDEPSTPIIAAAIATPTLSLTPGLHTISYAVVAAAGGSAQVAVDYMDTGGVPAHSVGTLPWQQSTQLTPGLVARLVAAGPVGQAFTVRIYVDGELAAEAEAVPVATEAGATAVWRAQCEALPKP